MKISKEDFLLLTAMAEFHFKFSEYIRENNEELFFRAIDYAQTFTQVEGIKFDYWHENNKQFLKELATILLKKKTTFEKLVNKLGSEEEATELWIAKKKTNKEDVLGIKNYLSNFMRHAKELDYESFDLEDWSFFVDICKNIKDVKFIDFAKSQISKILGPDSIFIKDLSDE